MAQFDLVFSTNESEFKLPGLPIRDAVTNKNWDEPIKINLNRINDPSKKYDFILALKLMIHEFGHKIPSLSTIFGTKYQFIENIQEIQKIAEKLGEYLNARASRVVHNNTLITIYHLPSMSIEWWNERTLLGYVPEVNHPRTFDTLSVHNQEGFYVLAENKNYGVKDLTNQFLESFLKNNLVSYRKVKGYNYVPMNWFYGTNIIFEAVNEQELRVQFNLQHSQVIVPVWKNHQSVPPNLNMVNVTGHEDFRINSFSQDRNGPFQLSFLSFNFKKSPRVAKSMSLTLDTTQIKIKTLPPPRPQYEKPGFKVEFQNFRWVGKNHLVIEYKLDPLMKRELLPEQFFETNPSLTLKLDQHHFDVRGIKSEDATKGDHWEFHLRDLSLQKSSRVEVVEIYLGLQEANLAVPEADFKINLLLDQQVTIPISEKEIRNQESKAVPLPEPKLIEILVGDGHNQFNSLNSNSRFIPKGSHLRFIFESHTKLIQLAFQQCFTCIKYVSTTLATGTSNEQTSQPWLERTPSTHYLLQLDSEKVHQTLEGNKLIVDVEIDSQVKTSKMYSLPLRFEPFDFDMNDLKAKENYGLFVEDLRGITSLHFTNQNLSGGDYYFKSPLSFYKSIQDLSQSCRNIFK